MKVLLLAIGAVAVLGVSGYFIARGNNRSLTDAGAASNNVVMDGGVQTVTVMARGGYSPRVSKAQAGVPTTLVLKTQNTFDCSLAVVIPSLNYRKYLPATGQEAIDLPPQAAGSTLNGTCAMGMYRFAINFK